MKIKKPSYFLCGRDAKMFLDFFNAFLLENDQDFCESCPLGWFYKYMGALYSHVSG